MKKAEAAKKQVGHGISQFELTNYLLQNLNKFELTPVAKLVLLELSACYNPNKPDMFPKQKTLALKCGVSERSVTRAVQELFKAGLIMIECKYTNRYKFTSKIGFLPAQNEKKFNSDNLSGKIRQDDRKDDDNLSPDNHEQIREQIKEPESVEDFKILKDYAERRGAKNTGAYINALKNSGAAGKIISDSKTKAAADSYYKQQIEETRKRNAKYTVWVADDPKKCSRLNEVLKSIKGVE